MTMRKIDINEFIGAVKIRSKWRFFIGYPIEWVMDFQSYEPSYDPNNGKYIYRNNLLLVNENNADEFCVAMKENELTPNDAVDILNDIDYEFEGITFLIDFDNKFYVNGFFDLPFEDYIPNEWTSIFGDPEEYIPKSEMEKFNFPNR